MAMKALEFQTQINPDRTLTLPDELAAQVQPEQAVRVILLIAESTEEQDWAQLTTEQFVNGYAESDAIYDDLPAG